MELSSEKVVNQKKKRIFAKDQLFFLGMIIPGIIFILIFSYGPMFGLLMAFQDYVPAKGVLGSEFVGLEHFRYLFSLPDIFLVTQNTIFIAFWKIVFNTIVPILFAILLNEVRMKWLKSSIQTIVYLPHFLSWVILASVVVNLFSLDGTVNQILQNFGLEPLNFLGNNHLFPRLLIGTDVWKSFGYSSIVYLAAITAIDPGLYEAATMDGASWSKKVWHVTLPGMLPFILLMTILSLPNILNAGFDQIYNLYSPVVYQSGDIIDTYVYRIGLIGRDYSLGTAVGLVKSVIGLILIYTSNKIAEKKTDRVMF
ncbi:MULTISPECIES: sugar ABC transporter permease [unclassified Enterococcus]|uniref:ABC transporter permease n=1 Tax=unclassified Enterococcus TaxID=2608891 RepID=UPI0006B9B89A|nr:MULTISPECIES: ABC transporter permease subunit [unclassified Enterococcus]KPG68779.1 sugar ABC transporter permease [Enterococcus sp. RIT-PI-f]